MRKIILNVPIYMLMLCAFNTHASETGIKLTLSPDGTKVSIIQNGVKKTCALASRASSAILSHDKQAIIVGSDHPSKSGAYMSGYIELLAFNKCKKPLVSTDIALGNIEDINIDHQLYISVDVVSVRPHSYAGMVGRVGSSKALANLPAPLRALSMPNAAESEWTFPYDWDDPEARARISLDGRYVSISGSPDCSEYAHPGVWDLQTKSQVIFEGSDEDIRSKCNALFDKKKPIKKANCNHK